jgi:hypothetical protein
MKLSKVVEACGYELAASESCHGPHECGPWCTVVVGNTLVAHLWGAFTELLWLASLNGWDESLERSSDRVKDEIYRALMGERGYLPRSL